MRVLLVSTYDLGHQPFGLASPAAWLRARGHEVECADASLGPVPEQAFLHAERIAFYLPMHTATRLAIPLIERARRVNPSAPLCCFGLYAALNRELLLTLGVDACFGGEFETALAGFAAGSPNTHTPALPRQRFLVPDRSTLPPLSLYPKLVTGSGSVVAGYTEASRGCKHLCRHCPIVPVYRGAFRVVSADVVLADIRQQVEAGARHITFGDPDFFNGPAHAQRIVELLHRQFPFLTYDATIKIEHLLKHRAMLPVLRRTGCLFITSAVESLDDAVLAHLDKGHTRAGFFAAAKLLREAGLTLSPTFIPFTPWTTAASYRDLLASLHELELVENTAPVQLALRLLIPPHSLLLGLSSVAACIERFDAPALLYRWKHPDPAIDWLAAQAIETVQQAQRQGASRREIFERLWNLAHGGVLAQPPRPSRSTTPYLEEPWYC
jgi:radical SAM superfamily enzyme YgiQ (UPF0313 family)